MVNKIFLMLLKVPQMMKSIPSILTILKKISNILKGWYFKVFNKNKKLANKRISVCNKCEERMHIDIVGDICSRCGCVLSAKARVEDEECELNKW